MGKGSKPRARALKSVRKRKSKKTQGRPARRAKAAPAPISVAPTPQQDGKGQYRKAKLMGGPEMVVNLAEDMIGRLLSEGLISHEQEQAARVFQAVRAEYIAELGTKGYSSCLDMTKGGHDESDGNPQAIAEYRHIERAIGISYTSVLADECSKGPDQKPHILGLLKAALSALATRC